MKTERAPKPRAPRNRTLTCSPAERTQFGGALLRLAEPQTPGQILNRIIHQDFFTAVPNLPPALADLLILDPPYNLAKDYHGHPFPEKDAAGYQTWFSRVIDLVKPCLKPDATVYVCADWRTSILIAPLLERHFHVRNRITWEREKGRGAGANWKNNTEDIWFCTTGRRYTFQVDSVKLKRKVIAPYRHADGRPKDWDEGKDGNFRLTHPSNIWTDLTVPFWSMPENTDHPAQKPEKLIAKLVLASSKPGDVVFDPFLGSGTTAVVCKKLNRSFVGIEQNLEYCCWTMMRLDRTQANGAIQGYADGVFWDRNCLADQKTTRRKARPSSPGLSA